MVEISAVSFCYFGAGLGLFEGERAVFESAREEAGEEQAGDKGIEELYRAATLKNASMLSSFSLA